MTFILAVLAEASFTFKFTFTDYTKPRRIVTMTPNKLAVYFVADMVWPIWLWPILIFRVADMVFCCGRYGRTP